MPLRRIGGYSVRAGPRRYSAAGRPVSGARLPPVGRTKSLVPITLRLKFRGSSGSPHTASYTVRRSPMVKAGPQKAAASVVYSSRRRARSTASARIVSWSKASVPADLVRRRPPGRRRV